MIVGVTTMLALVPKRHDNGLGKCVAVVCGDIVS